MGFLDDAIREHLDLKRRRGADPTEVERAEREALGPVRRDPFEHDDDEPQAEFAGTQPEGAYDQAAERGHEEYEANGDDWGDAFEEAPPAERQPEPEHLADEPGPLADEPEPFSTEPFSEEEPFAEEPSFPAPHPADAGAGEETMEYDVEGAFADEHAHTPAPPAHEEPPHRDEEPPQGEEDRPDGEEDVLEETPEFLQDAPEHDRLWFEQRPPRDFDFDG